MQEDTFKGDGINFYEYASNNLKNNVDPSR